jgi:hypothetical protein
VLNADLDASRCVPSTTHQVEHLSVPQCDETPETCNQCRRLGLTCSGALQGSIVIDMTERVTKPRGRKKKETARATMVIRGNEDDQPSAAPRPILPQGKVAIKSSQPSSPSSNSTPPSATRDTDRVEQAIVAIRYQYRPPIMNQPSRVLPEALDTARKPAVRLSLRAVSMAYFGKHHHDPSILVDSWRW